jgi:hypothetical protein
MAPCVCGKKQREIGDLRVCGTKQGKLANVCLRVCGTKQAKFADTHRIPQITQQTCIRKKKATRQKEFKMTGFGAQKKVERNKKLLTKTTNGKPKIAQKKGEFTHRNRSTLRARSGANGRKCGLKCLSSIQLSCAHIRKRDRRLLK